MSKYKNFKKEEIEFEKLETGAYIDKSANSGTFMKSKLFTKDDILNNKSVHLKYFQEKEEDKKSDYSIPDSPKTSKEKKIQKNFTYNIIDDYHTFNNNNPNKISPASSELDIFEKKQLNSNDFYKNYLKTRVRVFVPAKESESIFKEIDEEEEKSETENYINNKYIQNKGNINSIYEEQKLKHIYKSNEEEEKIEENKDLSKSERNINIDEFDINKFDENNTSKKVKKKLYRNVDINADPIEKIEKNDTSPCGLGEILKRKDKKFIKEIEKIKITFTTNIFFKYGKYSDNINDYQNCILLIRNNYLYVINPDASAEITDETIRFFNPDISLLNNLYSHEDLENNNNILKNLYNISSPLLCLNFNLLSCILLKNKNNIREFQIMILGSKNSYSFIVEEKETFKKLIFTIRYLINKPDNSRINKLGLSLRTNLFYKDTYLSVSEFEKTCKTGDLLLFRTDDYCATCQRMYTLDKYDHIAVIVKLQKISIFESTSYGKCNLLLWKDFCRWSFNLAYFKIAYRKLNYENKEKNKEIENQNNFENKFFEFLDKLKGKDYYLSIPKFLCCKKPESYEKEKKWEETKGFCCSALVAAMYLTIGIMKLEKSVHSTKPGDFEQDRNCIRFNEGYSLGPEKIIEFSE